MKLPLRPHKLIAQFIIISVILTLATAARAANVSTSYVNPFPAGGKYNVLVIGDGFADGAWYGLIKANKNNRKIQFLKHVNYSSRLTATGKRDFVKKLDKVLNSQIFDIAVVMVGYHDRRRVRVNGKNVGMDTPEWVSHYNKRIRAVLRKLAMRKIAVYWVGMPIVRRDKLRTELDQLNNLFKVQASAAQVRFIDNWHHFADDNGIYNSYGPDVKGKIRLLRKRDGVFFTKAGYEKLGYYIYKYIQRDLRDARAERNISLIGGKRDQEFLLTRYELDHPRNRKKNANAEEEDKARNASKLKRFMGLSNERSKYETAKHSSITIPADKTQSGKEKKIKIIRPAIPAVAFTIARRSSAYSSGDREFDGAALMQEKSGKLISLSIASAIAQFGEGNSERRVPLTQTPYYKLVVRGDAQLSKPGRADHFNWKLKPPEKPNN